MDPRHFDTLAKSLATTSTRRALLRLLAALPLAGTLVLLGGHAPTQADRSGAMVGGHRHRRRAHHRHHPGRHQAPHHPHHHHPHHHSSQGCRPESRARTCAGTCGTVTNNCQKSIDCGSCACDPPCAACLRCDAATGGCLVDAAQQDQGCGQEGQVCQRDGACACRGGTDETCGACRTCQGNGTCGSICEGSGCCDGTTCQPGTADTACGTGGHDCRDCTASDQTCGGGTPGTIGVCGCTPTTCAQEGKTAAPCRMAVGVPTWTVAPAPWWDSRAPTMSAGRVCPIVPARAVGLMMAVVGRAPRVALPARRGVAPRR